MKRLSFALVALAIVAGTGSAANAQTADTTGTVAVPPVAVPPVAPPPPTPPPATPPPAAKPVASSPMAYRYGGISGLYTLPQGDFDKVAGSGWGILIMGEQFVNPSHMVAITSDVGYLDFGSKSVGSTKTDFSMFPVQAGLRVYPMMQKKPDSKMQLFGEGGLGFYYTRREIGSASEYDYFFGTNAGAGVRFSVNPNVAFLFDATWNWVFANDPDPNYLALRGALMIPIVR